MTDLERIEINERSIIVRSQELRCLGMNGAYVCNKLLSKIQIYVSANPDIIKKMEEFGYSLSQIVSNVEIKLGIEMKCNRCKNMEYKLDVV